MITIGRLMRARPRVRASAAGGRFAVSHGARSLRNRQATTIVPARGSAVAACAIDDRQVRR
jgi:hypothetical protein